MAYYLVFVGAILVSSTFEAPSSYLRGRVGEQLQEALVRVADLLLTMGLLHAVTFMALPLVALVFNTTRTNEKMPRWVVWLLVASAAIVPFIAMALGGVIGTS